jgi:hypothetical protein
VAHRRWIITNTQGTTATANKAPIALEATSDEPYRVIAWGMTIGRNRISGTTPQSVTFGLARCVVTTSLGLTEQDMTGKSGTPVGLSSMMVIGSNSVSSAVYLERFSVWVPGLGVERFYPSNRAPVVRNGDELGIVFDSSFVPETVEMSAWMIVEPT